MSLPIGGPLSASLDRFAPGNENGPAVLAAREMRADEETGMNRDPFDSMIDQFEQGRIGRRQLAVKLGALAAAWAGAGRFANAAPPQESEKSKSTFDAKGLNHLALRVTDVARSRDWYNSGHMPHRSPECGGLNALVG